MNTSISRFYRSGDLPPQLDDMVRVWRALQRNPMTREALIARAALSQTRTLCVIDSLIAAGKVAYDTETHQFSPRPGG